ncbi:unnamed protein product, partial [Scytosiphon promiscuus]
MNLDEHGISSDVGGRASTSSEPRTHLQPADSTAPPGSKRHVGAERLSLSSSSSSSSSNNNHNNNNHNNNNASLNVDERCRLLTFEDRAWCALVANMAARLDRRAFPGQAVRFEVQAPSAFGGARASFQATTLEAEISCAVAIASQADRPPRPETSVQTTKKTSVPMAGSAIENAALAYGNPPTAVTFAEAFLRDTGAFFLAMDTVSNGRFLRCGGDGRASASPPGSDAGTIPSRAATSVTAPPPPDDRRPVRRDIIGGGGGGRKGAAPSLRAAGAGATGAAGLDGLPKSFFRSRGSGGRGAAVSGPASEEGEGWRQFSWLREMGGFSLAAFLANRVEARLRAAAASLQPTGTGEGVPRLGTLKVAKGGGGGASELVEAKKSLLTFLVPLGEEETRQALAACAAQSVTSLLRGKRDPVEMAMYKSGFLGGRPQAGIPPRKRYEDMDWVRGRPPDALLFLKALLKTAPSGLSVRPPASTTTTEKRMDYPRSSKLGSRPHSTSTASSTVLVHEEGGGGGGDDDDGDNLVLAEGARTLDASSAPGTTAPRSSGTAFGGKVGTAVPPRPGAAVARSFRTEDAESTLRSPSMVESVGVTAPRRLAEGALLGPLRDVGTVAGALRNGVGSSLREMAAARAAKDLSDLILQEAESAAAAAAATLESSNASPTRMTGGPDGHGGGGGGNGSVTKSRSGKKKKKPKKKRGGSSLASASTAGGGGESRPAVKMAARDLKSAGQCPPAAQTGTVTGSGGTESGPRAGVVAAYDARFSSDSSDDDGRGATTAGTQRTMLGSSGSGGGGEGGVGVGQAEGEGDESMDDEEEQRGVVKKLRWRTEIGRMGPSASPAGTKPLNTASTALAPNGFDDGFVSPLDLRRKGKVRALAHALVLETVEAALAQCKPPPQSPLRSGASDPRKAAGEAWKKTSSMPPPPPPPPPLVSAVASRKSSSRISSSKSDTRGAVAKRAEGAIANADPKAEAESQRRAAKKQRQPPTAAAATATEAPLSARRWASPENSVAHPLWRIPATPGGPHRLPESTANRVPVPGAAAAAAGSAFGTAVAPPSSSGAGGVATMAAPPGRTEGGVRSPSLVGLGSPRPPGAFVARRREPRRELAVNDADERMSWSSFDSLDVRVDDQDFADILDMAYRPSRVPPHLRAQQTAATHGPNSSLPVGIGHGQTRRVAPGYFASPSSPQSNSALGPPALPTAAAAAFHNHGMALDWRSCSGGTRTDGGGDADGSGVGATVRAGGSGLRPQAAAGLVAGVSSPEGSQGKGDGDEVALVESVETDDLSAADGEGTSERAAGAPDTVGVGTDSVGYFAPQVGSGSSSSFFGGQGLFLWTPSLAGQRGTADGKQGAWGAGARGVAEPQKASVSWGSGGGGSGGGGGTVADESWVDGSSPREESVYSPEVEAAASVGQGEGLEEDRREVAEPGGDGETVFS